MAQRKLFGTFLSVLLRTSVVIAQQIVEKHDLILLLLTLFICREVINIQTTPSHLKQNSPVSHVLPWFAAVDDQLLLSLKRQAFFLLELRIALMLQLSLTPLLARRMDLNLILIDGVLAEVADRDALTPRRLQLLQELAHALQIQYRFQVDFGIEAILRNFQLLESLMLARVPPVAVLLPLLGLAVAARGEHKIGGVAPEVLLEGLPAVELGAQVTPPAILEDIVALVSRRLPIVVQRLEDIKLILELLVVSKNKAGN